MHLRERIEALKGKISEFLSRYCNLTIQNREQPTILDIGTPFNFRREDVTIAGLSDVEQKWIREKAMNDASRMNLRPLQNLENTDDMKPYAFSPFHSASMTNINALPYMTPATSHLHTLQRHKSYDNVMEKTTSRSVFNDEENIFFHSARGDALLRKISSGLLASRESSLHASPTKLPYRSYSMASLAAQDSGWRSAPLWRGSRITDEETGLEESMTWRNIAVRA